MAFLFLRSAQLWLLAACVDGKREKDNVGAKLAAAARLQQTQGAATALADEVGGNASGHNSTASCVLGTRAQCQGDGWFFSNNQCCYDGYVTCKEGSYDWCQSPPWKYLGSSQCCTTAWAVCEDSTYDFCKGDGWSYLGNSQCCYTSPNQQWLTCETGSYDFCKTSPWKYLGDLKCCTTDYTHCEDGSYDYCRGGDGWDYLGKNKCCATSPHKLSISCWDGSTDSCNHYGGKFLGSNKCCASYCQTLCAKSYWADKAANNIDQRMSKSMYVTACIKQKTNKGEC